MSRGSRAGCGREIGPGAVVQQSPARCGTAAGARRVADEAAFLSLCDCGQWAWRCNAAGTCAARPSGVEHAQQCAFRPHDANLFRVDVNRLPKLTPRIASSANVTKAEATQHCPPMKMFG